MMAPQQQQPQPQAAQVVPHAAWPDAPGLLMGGMCPQLSPRNASVPWFGQGSAPVGMNGMVPTPHMLAGRMAPGVAGGRVVSPAVDGLVFNLPPQDDRFHFSENLSGSAFGNPTNEDMLNAFMPGCDGGGSSGTGGMFVTGGIFASSGSAGGAAGFIPGGAGRQPYRPSPLSNGSSGASGGGGPIGFMPCDSVSSGMPIASLMFPAGSAQSDGSLPLGSMLHTPSGLQPPAPQQHPQQLQQQQELTSQQRPLSAAQQASQQAEQHAAMQLFLNPEQPQPQQQQQQQQQQEASKSAFGPPAPRTTAAVRPPAPLVAQSQGQGLLLQQHQQHQQQQQPPAGVAVAAGDHAAGGVAGGVVQQPSLVPPGIHQQPILQQQQQPQLGIQPSMAAWPQMQQMTPQQQWAATAWAASQQQQMLAGQIMPGAAFAQQAASQQLSGQPMSRAHASGPQAAGQQAPQLQLQQQQQQQQQQQMLQLQQMQLQQMQQALAMQQQATAAGQQLPFPPGVGCFPFNPYMSQFGMSAGMWPQMGGALQMQQIMAQQQQQQAQQQLMQQAQQRLHHQAHQQQSTSQANNQPQQAAPATMQPAPPPPQQQQHFMPVGVQGAASQPAPTPQPGGAASHGVSTLQAGSAAARCSAVHMISGGSSFPLASGSASPGGGSALASEMLGGSGLAHIKWEYGNGTATSAQPGGPGSEPTSAVRSEAVVPDVGGFGGSLRANSGVPQLPASALLAGLLMPPPQPVGGLGLRMTRAERVDRYREKKARRGDGATVRYVARQLNAHRRPRIKGRFVKPGELVDYLAAHPDAAVPGSSSRAELGEGFGGESESAAHTSGGDDSTAVALSAPAVQRAPRDPRASTSAASVLRPQSPAAVTA